MKRLFGTYGIRAVAGQPPLDRPTVRKFGAALAEVLHRDRGNREDCRVVLGRDTRESGPWLRDAVVAGLASEYALDTSFLVRKKQAVTFVSLSRKNNWLFISFLNRHFFPCRREVSIIFS